MKPPKLSVAEKMDRELVASAMRKRQAGEQPTAQERAAVRRFERKQEEERRWEYYRTVPQKHYREMSGRQAKVLIEQSQRYGIPCAGKVIDIGAVLKWLHDFLAENKYRLAKDADDPLMCGDGDSPALERYRAANATLREMDVEQRKRSHVPLADLKAAMGVIFSTVKQSLEDVQRQYGDGPTELISEAADEAEQQCARLFESAGNGTGTGGECEPAPSPPEDDAPVCRAGNQDPDRAV